MSQDNVEPLEESSQPFDAVFEEENAPPESVDERLIAACAAGDVDVAITCLFGGAKPSCVDEIGRTPREVCLFFGHRECADAILVWQLAEYFPAHDEACLLTAAACSSSLESAIEWVLNCDPRPAVAQQSDRMSSSDPGSAQASGKLSRWTPSSVAAPCIAKTPVAAPLRVKGSVSTPST